jgi:PPK2 family polyphosphate:nucleotide phosphotransferase
MDIKRFRVRQGDKSPFRGRRPDDTGPFDSKGAAEGHVRKGLERLQKRQELLYAQDRYALLLVFQGMDAAGKDSVIGHVMSGVSPQGTEVHSFKVPSSEDLDHDYLWRVNRALPARGRIGIFNRSHYEEVLAVRVHPQFLDAQKLPADRVTRHIWKERFEDINAFERHLVRNGTVIRKFFLHVSRDKQRRRLLERIDDPAKNWKFSMGDLPERAKWKSYMAAYEEVLSATSTDEAPWFVIPADHKWFTHALVGEIIVKTLEGLDLAFPTLTPADRRGLRAARRLLEGHGRR